MFPLAIHGDGVPVQGRMNQSTLDFLTFNLPGSLKKASVRIPICCLDAQYNCGAETIEAIWSIIAWSLESLGKGKHPCGYPFSPKEKTSLDKAGQNMPGKCALVHIRGDWDFFCKWLGGTSKSQKEWLSWMPKPMISDTLPCGWRACARQRACTKATCCKRRCTMLPDFVQKCTKHWKTLTHQAWFPMVRNY